MRELKGLQSFQCCQNWRELEEVLVCQCLSLKERSAELTAEELMKEMQKPACPGLCEGEFAVATM